MSECKIKSKNMGVIGYLREGIYTIVSIAKGHWVTLVNLFRPKVTLQYPEVRWELPEGYRGLPTLPVCTETGKDLCIGCGACARVCPTQLIAIESHMGEDKKRVVDSFTINAGLCMFCGLCEDICPAHAIKMSKNYELAACTREEMMYDREKLNEMGGTCEPKPKPEPKEPAAAKSKEEGS